MARCTKLKERFYSMDLFTGKTMLAPNRSFHCFFIVEHTSDHDFIRKEALQLLMSQCKNFDFYGSCCDEWDLCFDEVDIMLHPGDDDEFALTSSWRSMDAFVDALAIALSTRTFIPTDIYLIYDDEEIYQTVLKKVNQSDLLT